MPMIDMSTGIWVVDSRLSSDIFDYEIAVHVKDFTDENGVLRVQNTLEGMMGKVLNLSYGGTWSIYRAYNEHHLCQKDFKSYTPLMTYYYCLESWKPCLVERVLSWCSCGTYPMSKEWLASGFDFVHKRTGCGHRSHRGQHVGFPV